MAEQLSVSVEFDVPATMRDGTILRANVFRPADASSKHYPVALTRTPYGKDFASVNPFVDAVRLARTGYIVVIQDVRGKFNSEGTWVSFENEAADGYDTVEWAATLPGSNGNVGMYGASYFGFTQWMAAKERPPHLKAIVPAITWADVSEGVVWRGGALELGSMGFWNLSVLLFEQIMRRYRESPAERFQAVKAFLTETDRLAKEGYFALPLRDFAPFKSLGIEHIIQDVLELAYQPEAYKAYSIGQLSDQVNVPSFNIGGWYDIFLKGTLDNFVKMRNSASPEAAQARLVIGPWSHTGYGSVVGEIDFGFMAASNFVGMQHDFTALTQRWFDYWLKGQENGLTKEAPVKLFIMGANVWRDEQEWPLVRTQYTPYYLHASGGLSTTPPRPDEASYHYTYDPANPTPTLGGNILMSNVFAPGPKDQRPLEKRSDVLVYTSAPLEEDLEVTGPVVVKLWAASDAPDTDFVARLLDVHPDGFSQNLADGIVRARYRNGATAEFLEPGQPYEFTIDLWATANVFKKGHSIRLHIASASFPHWDRNPNTGGAIGADSEMRPARQTVFHNTQHPSQVLLPVIPRP